MTAKENVPELTLREFSEILSKNKSDSGLVIIDFYAEWCMPCVMMEPIIDAVAGKKRKESIRFYKINTEETGEFSAKNKISVIPCLIFFKNGQEVGRVTGIADEKTIEEKIQEILYYSKGRF